MHNGNYLTLSNGLDRTKPGQASWAIGPHKCWECAHWMHEGARDREQSRTQAQRCRKYRELMPWDRAARNISGVTPCCRYFDPAK